MPHSHTDAERLRPRVKIMLRRVRRISMREVAANREKPENQCRIGTIFGVFHRTAYEKPLQHWDDGSDWLIPSWFE